MVREKYNIPSEETIRAELGSLSHEELVRQAGELSEKLYGPSAPSQSDLDDWTTLLEENLRDSARYRVITCLIAERKISNKNEVIVGDDGNIHFDPN